MFGSIFYNLWASLIGFTIYFVLALQNVFVAPIAIILGSFIAGLLSFIVMFPIRIVLSYILFTPEEVVLEEEIMTIEQDNNDLHNLEMKSDSSTVEFDDESTEDIAKVVRTMMHSEAKSAS